MFGYSFSHGRSRAVNPFYYPKEAAYTIRSFPLENRVVTIHEKQYKFQGELGAGGFGTVYAARRLPDNRPVAVKVISLATFDMDEAKILGDSMLNEIRMTKSLRKTSNHIINLFDFDFHAKSGLAFLVMERGERDLEQALQAYGHLPPQERRFVWRQLASIASTLHNRDIVHLDLKPSNLLVFPHNHIKLIDLGIAQRAATRRSGIYGTTYYSAPEVVGVEHTHSSRNSSVADAWSWGAILYRIAYLTNPTYDEPCYHPPEGTKPTKDRGVLDILKHTLVRHPRHRVNAAWLAGHPYSSGKVFHPDSMVK